MLRYGGFVIAVAAALAAAFAFSARAAAPAKPVTQPPSNVSVAAATQTSITISWRRAPGLVALYELYRNGSRAGFTFGTSFRFSSLRCGTSYRLEVVAIGQFGRSARVGITASTLSCGDTTPPSIPSGLTPSNATTSSIDLSWTASTDAGGVRGYGRYRDGTSVGDVAATQTSFTGLDCGKQYTLAVDAVDNAGNRSAQASIVARTLDCPDTTPPTDPTSLAPTAITGDRIDVSWVASTDNVGVTGYRLYADGGYVDTVTDTTHSFTGLGCGTPHIVEVEAIDAGGNRSGRAVLRTATASCGADLFVAPGGSDYRWSFITATYDGVDLDLYIDGKLASTTPLTGPISSSSQALRLGAGSTAYGEFFAGQMDDVRIYDHALGEVAIGVDMRSPVTATAADSRGIVAAYGFDEGAGTTLHDLSGNGNDGTLSAGATWTAGHAAGGLSFDGTGGVTVPDSSRLELSAGMTLEAWVRPTDLTDWRSAIYKGGDNLDYALYAHSTEPSHASASARVWTDAEHETHAANRLPGNNCTWLAPCATFDAAYHAAQSGQTVEAAAGNYGNQTITADATKADAAADIVLRPVSPDAVTVGTLTLAGPAHLELRDMHFGTWVAQFGSDHVTFRNDVAGRFLVDSVTNLSILGGSYGPTVDDDNAQVRASCPLCAPATDVLIDGVTFHDATISPGSDAHVECLQVGDVNGLTIRNSRFTNCETHNVFISPWWSNKVTNVLLENNIGGTVRTGFFSFRVAANDVLTVCTNVVFRNNSARGPMAIECGNANGVKLVGNLAPLTQYACDTRFTYSHNVWDGAQCDPSDLNAPTGFVDAAGGDFSLVPGAAAIDRGDPSDYPATDFFGHARPRGAAPDAGAIETG